MLLTPFGVLAAALGLFTEPPRAGTPVVPPADVALAMPPEKLVSREKIEAAIRALPIKRAGYPDADQREGLLKAQNDLIAALKALGYEPQLSDVAWAQRPKPGGEPAEPLPWKNIIVDIPGREAPSEMYVFSAHMDAVPQAAGADDDASGVAVMLEMARILKDRPMKRTLRLCFFNLEEAGLIGSRQYCERIQPDVISGKIKILGMASLDGVAYFSDKNDSQRWPELNMPNLKLPTVGNFIAVGGLLGGRTFSQPLIAGMKESDPTLEVFAGDILPLPVPDFLRSDHAPFLALGVPAVIIADTANFRSPHYHQPTDTVENIDFDRLTKVGRQIIGAAWRLAGPISPGAPAGTKPEEPPGPPGPPPADTHPQGVKPPSQPPGRTPETPRGTPEPRP
jgi:hypothetical protein